MKRLNNQDWSLIARYLKEETTQTDLVQLRSLLETYPGLQAELAQMERNVNGSDTSASDDFDADKAFQKLHERLRGENLV
jgi:hypothetical protein